MSEIYNVHKAEEMIDPLVNFEIWPFTVDTGCNISDLHEPHLHDFYVVQFVLEGGGTHIVDFKPFDVSPNSLFFVSPQQLHLWRPDGDIKGFVMVFTEEFLRASGSPFGSIFELEFFNSVAHSPMLHASDAQAETINESLQIMSKEFMLKDSGYASMIRAQFRILMVNLQRMFAGQLEKSKLEREPDLVRRFKLLAAQNFASQMSIQEYANQLDVSASRLNSVIKDTTAQTPGQIVRREMMLAAKRMLAHSDKNISEICFQLNFEDPSYFGRFFKREAGVSPSVFREQMREKYHQLAR